MYAHILAVSSDYKISKWKTKVSDRVLRQGAARVLGQGAARVLGQGAARVLRQGAVRVLGQGAGTGCC